MLLALSEAEGPGGEPLVRAAHDCSTGGLIQTLVDSCLRCGVGASVDLTAIQEEGVDDFTALFSESGARAIVAVREELVPAVTAAAEAEDVAVARLGTTGGDLLVVAGSDLLSDGGAGRPSSWTWPSSGPTSRASCRRCSESHSPTGISPRGRGHSCAAGDLRRRRGRESCPRTRRMPPAGRTRTRPCGMSPSVSPVP